MNPNQRQPNRGAGAKQNNGAKSNGAKQSGGKQSSGKQSGGKQSGGKQSGGKQNQKRSNKRRRKSSAKAARDFWGDPSKLPPEEAPVVITSQPGAVVASLGRPPLSGQEQAAQHYFDAVYERAVTMAGALAAASNLLETDDD